ncbi:interferon gamma 1 [Hoplias malabaricus]|uniref:interferon gamma 1 n=1 Tax=Hoplias malabaricus TaxID=27720 RepID=UPI003461A660
MKKSIMNLLLGICFLLFKWTSASEAHIPLNTKKTIEQLNDYYKTRDSKIFVGKPLFWGKLDGFEKPEQKLLMTIILDAYNRILSQMQNETQDESVQNNLIEVKEELSKLKLHYFSEKYTDFKKQASEVMALKETDPIVQQKALFELIKVYNEASNLGHTSVQSQRRRRQAKGSRNKKSRPRT